MSAVTLTNLKPAEGYCEKEVLRYAGCKEPTEEICELIKVCYEELENRLTYRLCYRKLSLEISDDHCDFGCFSVRSRDLAKNLKGCKSVIVFAATVGVATDRLIARYNRVSPARALIMQALGAERVEALCDEFCKTLAAEYNTRPRFSPGYGDLPLAVQKELFAALECYRHIGISLNESLLMAPSKSVTAFVGIY